MTLPQTGVIWASLPIPALLLDGENRVVEANPAAELFLNASGKALRGQDVGHVVLVELALPDIMARVRANQAALFINDLDIATPDRPAAHCSLKLAPIQDDPDHILMLISPRDLAEKLGRGNGVKTAAKSAIGMAEMLAHEIKNPLAGISGAAQLLSMGLSAEDRELTDLIVEETRRIVKLLEQVEQFGNLRPLELAAVNLHDVLDRARRMALVGYGAKMRIVEDFDPSLPLALADRDQLQQVFQNLIKNASEAAGPEGGTIRLRSFFDTGLRLRRDDGSVATLPLSIEIVDDGPGIPPAILPHMFEPFVSGKQNGTGLGLALVSKIISDHGGWISADSVPGRTVFRVSLPMAPPTAPPMAPNGRHK